MSVAARWFAAAAAEGNVQAMFALGTDKLQGRGVPKDVAGAADLFRQAAAKNHPAALYNLGMLDLQSTPPDFKAAADYFGRAAELGLPDAAYALALLYRNGRGVTRDDKVAAHVDEPRGEGEQCRGRSRICDHALQWRRHG